MREPRQRSVVRPAKQQQRRWPAGQSPSLNKTTELSGNRRFSDDEEELLIKLHALLGNRWSLIAGRLPGRTDEEVKNHWNWHMRRKLKRVGVNPDSHRANHLPSPDDHQISKGVVFHGSNASSAMRSIPIIVAPPTQWLKTASLKQGAVSEPSRRRFIGD